MAPCCPAIAFVTQMTSVTCVICAGGQVFFIPEKYIAIRVCVFMHLNDMESMKLPFVLSD